MASLGITPLPPKVQELIKTKFLGLSEGLVGVGHSQHHLPPHCTRYIHKFKEFKFLTDDTLIMTFPRSGTTWTQELIWCMTHGLDFNTAATTALIERSPFIEFDAIQSESESPPPRLLQKFQESHPGEDPKTIGMFLEHANHCPTPRTLKTHLPFSLLPSNTLDNCKVVYVARHPGDVCVSYYYHQRLVKSAEYIGNMEEFVDLWCQDHVLQGPYWGHLSETWVHRDHPNLLWLYYEDMRENLVRELKRINNFLGTKLTEEQLKQVAEHGSLSNMKGRASTNPSVSPDGASYFKKGEEQFIRKGAIGDWVNHFNPEMKRKFEAWVKDKSDKFGEVPSRYLTPYQ